MEYKCNLQISKHESKKDSTLNVDMWDNTMKGQSNEVHTDTLERISLEKNI